MTTVPATPSTTTTTTSQTATATAATAATVDYNSFLKLMIEEIKNQDPTKPSDPTQYLSQLASFSNVEQSIQTNTKLDSLLTTSSLSQAEGVIGKQVTSADQSISGKVVSVLLGSGNSATATLDNGKTLTLGTGVTVAAS